MYFTTYLKKAEKPALIGVIGFWALVYFFSRKRLRPDSGLLEQEATVFASHSTNLNEL
jgi:hypothetical protein